MTRLVSCGVVVTDGRCVLLGHATRSPRWDIPKGLAEPQETLEDAARRELQEETGLAVPPGVLISLGTHRYLPNKDLFLFVWHRIDLPDAATLVCTSLVGTGPAAFPEFDRFALPSWPMAFGMMGKSLRVLLQSVAAGQGWG